jgi:hypothetical protein
MSGTVLYCFVYLNLSIFLQYIDKDDRSKLANPVVPHIFIQSISPLTIGN